MSELIKKELKLNASLETLDLVLATIEEVMEAGEAPMKAVTQVQLAVEELYVNVANYAYGDNPEKPCTLDFVIEREEETVLTVTIIDHGAAFDPFAKEDPDITLSANERKIGGLGIFMTKNLMNEAEYQRNHDENIVTLRKKW